MKKHMLTVLLLSTFTFFAQDCKVLMKTINESYKGDCKKGKANGQGVAIGKDTYEGAFKKGLPHGEGTYTWSENGDIYNGTWEKGKKHGKGNLVKSDATILGGYWKNDEYIGLFEDPFKKIDKSQSVSSYSLKIDDSMNNVIRLYLKEDQKQVYNFGTNIIVHHGNYTNTFNSRDYIELQNVSFPFKAKVYFGQEFIEFEIFQQGMWIVRTDITRIKGLGN